MSLIEKTAKINGFLAAFAAILGASSWFQPAVAGSDLWWHLASGRDILERGGVPRADHFSWTAAGDEWMNHEWLWDIVYWSAYSFHPELVAWLNLALLVAIFSLAFAVARRVSGSAFAAGAAIWLAASSAFWFLDIRPHLTTLLLTGIFLLTRDHPRAHWFWPPAMVIWCNTHGGFAFGYGMIGLHVLVKTLRLCADARRLVIPWPLWFSVAGCTLAFLVNPWGYRILEYPLAYLDSDSPFRLLVEWRPPEFELSLRLFEGRFWLIGLFAIIGTLLGLLGSVRGLSDGLREKGLPAFPKTDPYLICLAAVCFQMAVTSRRFIPLFGIVAAPLVASGIRWGRDVASVGLPVLRTQAAGLTAIIAAVLVGSLLWTDVRIHPRLLHRWTEGNLYPEASLRYLQALNPGKRLLNYYNWGGYIMLHAPEFKVFIDGRANTLYGEKIYNDYQAMLNSAPGLAARMSQYPADAAILPGGIGRLARKMTEPPLSWKIVYMDQLAVILLPPNSPRLREPLPDAELVVGDHPDFLLARGALAMSQSDLQGGIHLVRQALKKDPLLVRAWSRLVRILASQGQIEQIRQEIETAIDLQPRRRFHLRSTEAVAYELAGKPDLALSALREGVPAGPFANRAASLARIAALERTIAGGDTRERPR